MSGRALIRETKPTASSRDRCPAWKADTITPSVPFTLDGVRRAALAA
jgi:hypothetical protein